jgi:5'-deoxynucleotidase YfbR-like HD superfamily hydrolase
MTPPLTWIQTYSGRRLDLLSPDPDDISIEDIAHALSMLCRFTGHTSDFYSVSQHSVLCSYICDRKDALWALLHDASEAYLNDLATPIKKLPGSSAYVAAEKHLQAVIYIKFGLLGPVPESVKHADQQMLVTEAKALMAPLHPEWSRYVDFSKAETIPPEEFDAWEPRKAKFCFLRRFLELTGDRRRAKDLMRRRVA